MKCTTFLCAALLCLIVSCKDKDKPVAISYCEENPGSCQSVLEGKRYFTFKAGSWWVYEEEISGQRDSVYVTDYSNEANYAFDIRTHSTLYGYNYHYWTTYAYGSSSCNTLDPVAGKCLYINRNKTKPGNYVGEGKCFFVNYKKDDFIYSYNNQYVNNKVIVDEILDTFTLGNYSFLKTIKVHELNTVIEGYQPTNHYFTKDIGLVRKELIDSNQVWNLVNYHIEP